MLLLGEEILATVNNSCTHYLLPIIAFKYKKHLDTREKEDVLLLTCTSLILFVLVLSSLPCLVFFLLALLPSCYAVFQCAKGEVRVMCSVSLSRAVCVLTTISVPGMKWVCQLVFRSKLTMHTAYDRRDNTEPASVTALTISKLVQKRHTY